MASLARGSQAADVQPGLDDHILHGYISLSLFQISRRYFNINSIPPASLCLAPFVSVQVN